MGAETHALKKNNLDDFIAGTAEIYFSYFCLLNGSSNFLSYPLLS